MISQNPRRPNQESFGTPPWESRDKKPFGYIGAAKRRKEYYMGKVVASPSSGRGESCESRVACD
jgi:hypothetical protein